MLIVHCIRSALKSGGGGDDDDDDDSFAEVRNNFAEAGARNSANSVLLKLTEKFAEKVKDRLEKNASLEKLLGSPAFVPFLFSTWMDANAWSKTLEAVRGEFFSDDDDGENNIDDNHKLILQRLNSVCLASSFTQSRFNLCNINL